MNTITHGINTHQNLQSICLERNIPFVSFCLPQQTEIVTLIRYSSPPVQVEKLNDLQHQSGFVVTPFSGKEGYPIFLLQPDFIVKGDAIPHEIIKVLSETDLNDNLKSQATECVYETSKESFMNQVNQIRKNIHDKIIDKAVLTRVYIEKENGKTSLPDIFSRMIALYPNSFRYIFQLPETGVWMGASPEPLLDIQEQIVETVSLAGTQKLNGTPFEQVTWKTKEETEQNYVTQFIENHLNALGIKDYTKKGPFNFRAANLVHLKSTFSFDKSLLGNNIGQFLSQLHPTPSVCGVPKNKAEQLIHSLEKHKREYYTGFLGPFQWEGITSLFVNLRCMKKTDNGFALFAGAGITAESVPDNEWEETVQKMATMLSVIQKEIR